MDSWYEITQIEQVLYIIAATATAMLLVHTAFFIRHYKKTDKGLSMKALLLDVRSILIFFAVGSWTTVLTYKSAGTFAVSFIVGGIAGIATALITAFCIYKAMQTERFPYIDLKSSIGSEGVVYDTISAKGEGRGRVSLVIDGRMRVFDAIAYEDNKISRGDNIKIVDALGSDLLLVESLKEEI